MSIQYFSWPFQVSQPLAYFLTHGPHPILLFFQCRSCCPQYSPFQNHSACLWLIVHHSQSPRVPGQNSFTQFINTDSFKPRGDLSLSKLHVRGCREQKTQTRASARFSWGCTEVAFELSDGAAGRWVTRVPLCVQSTRSCPLAVFQRLVNGESCAGGRQSHSSLEHVKDIQRLNDFQFPQVGELKVNMVWKMLWPGFKGLCECSMRELRVTKRLLLATALWIGCWHTTPSEVAYPLD